MFGRRRPFKLRSLTLGSVLVLVLAGSLVVQPATISGQSGGGASEAELRFQRDDFAEFDARTGIVQPSSAQLAAASSLGATARWNRFGSARSLIKYGGMLASGLAGDPATAVRAWIRANRVLFRLSDADVTNLELLHNIQLVDSSARALLFRQAFGGVPAAQDGLIAVGYVNGSIAYASSSTAAYNGAALGSATLSPAQAWQKAAANVGRTVALGDIQIGSVPVDGWTLLAVPAFAQVQRARVRALPTPSGIRLVYETIVLDVLDGESLAYTHMIDAKTGAVLVRHNRKQHADDVNAPSAAPTTTQFEGEYTPAACGPAYGFDVAAGSTAIAVSAAATVTTNDIVVNLLFGGAIVTHFDTATSPEVLAYRGPDGDGVIPAGAYAVQVCPYATPSVPLLAPYTYAGTVITDDTPVPAVPGLPDVVDPLAYPPKWRVFRATPPVDRSTPADDDTRTLNCYEKAIGPGDTVPVVGCNAYEFQVPGSNSVHDVSAETGRSTFTTIGNNAQAAQSWGSFVSPSAPYRPVSANRTYDYSFTNQWLAQKCNQAAFAANLNDTDAATANLFAMHNRMHDWSYSLGFTEDAYNLQQNNLGNASEDNLAGDPEIGNVQAGAVAFGAPTYMGRDNANQITLNDGIPGITNMYLWQPIAAAFYAPCVDGDFDMSVIGHEYGHAIQNRMVGGPDEGLTTSQGRSMGESWSDLTAIEYLNGYSLVPLGAENPFAVGAYVTGSNERGIRNYGMNRSPLNFGNVEYDGNGTTSPHADGEIWSAVNYDIRQALIAKYNSQFPASNKALQESCADGKTSANACPGNRRWVQIFHDAFLLMPGSVDMLDARDAYLAADRMRVTGTVGWPSNQATLWRSFARRGFGAKASSVDGEDRNPKPSFEMPAQYATAGDANATLTFNFTAADEGGAAVQNAKVYVGVYEARSTPIADTIPNSGISNAALFVPGTYTLTIVAPGYGLTRLSNQVVTAGQGKTFNVGLRTNYASASKGATASGPGVNLNKLIDDTEATNYANLNVADIRSTRVTIDLPGTAARTIKHLRVSASLRPAEPNDAAGDTAAQSRFTALRQFELYTCDATGKPAGYCSSSANFKYVMQSSADAFPGARPRPSASDLIMRVWDVPSARQVPATHVRIRVLSNQCTGGPDFQGDQDSDASNNSDCKAGSDADLSVRIAELQLFTTRPPF